MLWSGWAVWHVPSVTSNVADADQPVALPVASTVWLPRVAFAGVANELWNEPSAEVVGDALMVPSNFTSTVSLAPNFEPVTTTSLPAGAPRGDRAMVVAGT